MKIKKGKKYLMRNIKYSDLTQVQITDIIDVKIKRFLVGTKIKKEYHYTGHGVIETNERRWGRTFDETAFIREL